MIGVYRTGAVEVVALDHATLPAGDDEVLALVGPDRHVLAEADPVKIPPGVVSLSPLSRWRWGGWAAIHTVVG